MPSIPPGCTVEVVMAKRKQLRCPNCNGTKGLGVRDTRGHTCEPGAVEKFQARKLYSRETRTSTQYPEREGLSERADAIRKLGWLPEDPANGADGRYAADTGELVRWASLAPAECSQLEKVVAQGGVVIDAQRGLLLVPMTMDEYQAVTNAAADGRRAADKTSAGEWSRVDWFLNRAARLWKQCVETRSKASS